MCPVSLGFKTPLDPSIIWRYMPLSKFYTFVQSSALWFAAASSFPDRFEGTKAAAESVVGSTWSVRGTAGDDTWTHRLESPISFVNCWMMNTKESDLMWRAYAGANGVAIESTYGRLRSVLPEWIFIHEVEYIDYERDRMINGHSLAPIFYKRKEFADERELRAVVDVFPVGDARPLGTKPLPTGKGN